MLMGLCPHGGVLAVLPHAYAAHDNPHAHAYAAHGNGHDNALACVSMVPLQHDLHHGLQHDLEQARASAWAAGHGSAQGCICMTCMYMKWHQLRWTQDWPSARPQSSACNDHRS